MKPINHFYGLLALLFVGSASAWAEGDDPFGNLNPRLYQGNMTITGQVVQNGVIVTDALVAAYCEDVLRGKEAVGTGTPTDRVFLSVFGNNTGYRQYLYFKVYTGGHIYTYHPDPAIEWTYDGSVGTTASPYIIDITPVGLANDADNTATLTTWKDKTCDVVLTGRTLYRDGAWNTLCLPLTLSEAQIAAGDLAGATIMELDATGTYSDEKGDHKTGFDAADGTPYLYFKTATSIEAGRPYIVKWPDGSDQENPVFTNVTFGSSILPTTVSAENSGLGTVQFIGTYSPTPLTPNDKSNLFLGAGSTLYYPNAANNADGNYYAGACRAYFHVNLDGAAGVRAFVLSFDDTNSIHNSKFKIQNEEDWYDLSGRKMVNGKWSARPKDACYQRDARMVNGRKGIYIHNGKKYIVK